MSTVSLSSPASPHAASATGMVRQALDSVARFVRVRQGLAQVRRLDDHLLRDIGLTRAQAEHAVRMGRAA